MIDKIIEQLYLGDANDVFHNKRHLKARHITHILTVSALGVPEEQQVPGIVYEFVFALDVSTQDFFAGNLLEKALTFIENAIKDGGNVLVHCEAGISRSPFIVTAYMMKLKKWSAEQALQYVQECRCIVSPNDGFIKQLHIFEHVGYSTDMKKVLSCQEYIVWRQNCEKAERLTAGVREKNFSDDKRAECEYRCGNCDAVLFFEKHILRHKLGTKSDQKDDTTDKDVFCELGYLVPPMTWMNMTEYQGKISCLKCGVKLGTYVWGGRLCDGEKGVSCGASIRPWVHIPKSGVRKKVDIEANQLITRPPDLEEDIIEEEIVPQSSSSIRAEEVPKPVTSTGAEKPKEG